MSKWKKGQLSLGRLGKMRVLYDGDSACRGWFWEWDASRRYVGVVTGAASFVTEESAQCAAERWLRAALKQVTQKIGG